MVKKRIFLIDKFCGTLFSVEIFAILLTLKIEFFFSILESNFDG
jgi:hypothetical protein